jgi:hypothetical protein
MAGLAKYRRSPYQREDRKRLRPDGCRSGGTAAARQDGARGNARPRVATSVSMSSSQRNTHSRTLFRPSRPGEAHRIWTRQPRE